MRKSLRNLFALFLLVSLFLVTACGQQSADTDENKDNEVVETEDNENKEDSEEVTEAEDLDSVVAVLITDQGGINDKSFNQTAYDGLIKAGDEGWVEHTYIESHSESDYLPNIERALDSDPNIIWSIGYALWDATAEIAKNNPDYNFAIIDFGNEENLENVIGTIFADHENSFLAGYAAGMVTETDNVGLVLGTDSPVMKRFEYGYRAGVMEAARERGQEIVVQVEYAESFIDVAKGKTMANQMYEKGADVIFQAAGATGAGVIEAAKENNKYVIGVDRDQKEEAPDHMLLSTIKGVDVAVYEITKELKEGRFPGGETRTFSLDGGGVDIAYADNDLVPQEVKNRIEELKEAVINGEIEVPETAEEYENSDYKDF